MLALSKTHRLDQNARMKQAEATAENSGILLANSLKTMNVVDHPFSIFPCLPRLVSIIHSLGRMRSPATENPGLSEPRPNSPTVSSGFSPCRPCMRSGQFGGFSTEQPGH